MCYGFHHSQIARAGLPLNKVTTIVLSLKRASKCRMQHVAWLTRMSEFRLRLRLRTRLPRMSRSEEHTSELQSPYDLVCRLLLEKKKKKNTRTSSTTTVILSY